MTTFIYSVGGVIDPSRSLSACSHSTENAIAFSDLTNTVSNLSVKKLRCDLETSIKKTSEQKDPFFWKTRTIASVAVSEHINTICFLPTRSSFKERTTLFVEKNIQEPPFKGFFAPFLPNVVSQEWECINFEDFIKNYYLSGKVCLLDTEEASKKKDNHLLFSGDEVDESFFLKEKIDDSLKNMVSKSLKDEVKRVLMLFLRDKKSVLIGLTYSDADIDPATRFWCKSNFEAELEEACRLQLDFTYLLENRSEH